MIFKYLILFSFSLNVFATAELQTIRSASLISKSKRKSVSIDWINSKKKKITLKDYQGKVLYLNFWASWCSPCIAEVPTLKRVAKFFNAPSFKLLFVNMDEKGSLVDAHKFFTKNIRPAETIFTSKFDYKNELDVETLPTHIILDKEGRVASKFYGSISSGKLEKKITKMIYQLSME